MLNGTGQVILSFPVFLAGILFFVIGFFISNLISSKKNKSAGEKAKQIIGEAQKEAQTLRKEIELEAKDLKLKLRSDFDQETKDARQELKELEKRLTQREENIERKSDLIDRKEKDITQKEQVVIQKQEAITNKEAELDRVLAEEKQKLQRVAGMSSEEAKKLLVLRMQDEAKQEAAITLKRLEEQVKESADKKAREIISLSIQRYAADHTVESTISVVSLPNDDMKGRIIGREGRNIRALEVATGVDVIVDDTPEAVTLSSFDIVRREIARRTLEKLIEDGRIHPGRIEEVVEKVKKEMDVNIREEGEKAAFDVNIHGLHPELIKLLGRLKYRTSYGQNALQHSKEVAYIMGVMAGELNIDFNLSKRIGLLHDIGKAVSHEVEGGHAKIGADLARKYGETEAVIHAIEAHHQDIEANSVMAVLVQAADAISATRPGARRETLETYVKRLEKLEGIADGFKGVEKSFAIQAGREVRVIVQPDKINDLQAISMAKDMAKKIEENLDYPGEIKVTIIRETRAMEYAR
ncbi:MAG: ribonuclease Y [Candidatus Omnitrophica bacterium]|nr:ribonuclease Y [Candidatus Omnitrophota bacterium]